MKTKIICKSQIWLDIGKLQASILFMQTNNTIVHRESLTSDVILNKHISISIGSTFTVISSTVKAILNDFLGCPGLSSIKVKIQSQVHMNSNLIKRTQLEKQLFFLERNIYRYLEYLHMDFHSIGFMNYVKCRINDKSWIYFLYFYN